ncbi:hypothetical protein GCM10027088_60300 [Nocardia goodfellowii]
MSLPRMVTDRVGEEDGFVRKEPRIALADHAAPYAGIAIGRTTTDYTNTGRARNASIGEESANPIAYHTSQQQSVMRRVVQPLFGRPGLLTEENLCQLTSELVTRGTFHRMPKSLVIVIR